MGWKRRQNHVAKVREETLISEAAVRPEFWLGNSSGSQHCTEYNPVKELFHFSLKIHFLGSFKVKLPLRTQKPTSAQLTAYKSLHSSANLIPEHREDLFFPCTTLWLLPYPRHCTILYADQLPQLLANRFLRHYLWCFIIISTFPLNQSSALLPNIHWTTFSISLRPPNRAGGKKCMESRRSTAHSEDITGQATFK